jgi:hypothetical protein
LRQAFFSCGKAGFFSRQMHGGEQFRKNAPAMILRKIFRQFDTAP